MAAERRGLSLVEVLVVGAIFAGLLTVLVLLEIGVQRQSRANSQETALQDALALAMEACRRELRGTRLVTWTPSQLRYRRPHLDSTGALQAGPLGDVLFYPAAPDTLTIQVDENGDLRLVGPANEKRKLGALGKKGSWTLESADPTHTDLLRMRFVCKQGTLERSGSMTVYFRN